MKEEKEKPEPAKALRLSINLDDYVISKEAFERLQKGIA